MAPKRTLILDGKVLNKNLSAIYHSCKKSILLFIHPVTGNNEFHLIGALTLEIKFDTARLTELAVGNQKKKKKSKLVI